MIGYHASSSILFIIFDVTYCNIIYFLFLILPDVDQKCRDMEVSLGLSDGKLADTWSSLSGGKKWEGEGMGGEGGENNRIYT